MSNMTNQNKTDEETKSSPRRTRNSSARDQAPLSTAKKMAGKLPEVNETELEEASDLLIPKDDFSKKTQNQKLDTMADAINKMYNKMNEVTDRMEKKLKPIEDIVTDPDQGVLPQLEGLVEHAKSADDRIQSLAEENLQLRDELDIIKGIVHKISNQCNAANSKINQLVAKSMEDNLVISGITDDKPNRSARRQVHQFLYEEMELSNINDMDIIKVYRMGPRDEGRNRPILVQCTADLRRYIM